MGRRKIEIQPITHERNRSVTFLKRKNGLFKKAYELGVLCSVDVAIIIFNPAGTSNKLFEFTSTDLDSLIRRRSEFQGECNSKTAIDFSHDGARPGHAKGNGDSDEDEDDSDVPVSSAKAIAQSNKRRVSGTKSRPARGTTLSGLQEEKPDFDELEQDTILSHSTVQRSPNPHQQVNGSDDETDRITQERRHIESGPTIRNPTGDRREYSTQDGHGAESCPSPHSSGRQHPGYSNGHDPSHLVNLGLPLSLGHLASQITPQQLSSLAPHLGALASQQQLSGLTAQQLNSLSPQHQELLALHAVKQQQQLLHLQQREQLANLQNSLRAPNRLATVNLNFSGIGNFGSLGGMESLGNLGNLSGLGERNQGSLGLGSSLGGLPIRKTGLGGANNFSSLTSVSSSGTSGVGDMHQYGNSTPFFNNSSLSTNNSLNSNGNASHEQAGPSLSADDGSWLDFLSLPAGRIDHSALSGLSSLSSVGLGGLIERESAVRGGSQSDPPSSLFGLPFGTGTSNKSNRGNAAFGSGVASGGGYGLGVGLGNDGPERRGTPIERNELRGEAMDLDNESGRDSREHERRGRSAERGEREQDDESHLRKRPRWE